MANGARRSSPRGRPAAEVPQRQLEMNEELGDKAGSIWATRNDLQKAGFTSVDCLDKDQVTAVMVALTQAD